MLACPVHVIRYEWDSAMPFVKKCDLCFDRTGGPACVQSCPENVSIYGEREDLLNIAHQRIAANPDKYEQKVWGEKDMGGTAVMYISDSPLDELWPVALGETSIPQITWPIANKTPFLALGVAGFLTGATWLIGRRNRLAEEKAELAKTGNGEE
jgi:formate dehydrogenase iron-sulfur subunit